MDQVIGDALSGDMLVPQIGCSGCREKEEAIRGLVARVRQLEQLVGMADEFISAYQASQATRETRRAASRKRGRAGLSTVPSGPTPKAPPRVAP
jgi:hypothetical protein